MMNSLVTVIVPVYNVEKYIQKCIDSIVNQTYKNLEIILVNDGSKDNSLNICLANSRNDRRIIVINKDNEGVSKARNVAIEKAKGQYLVFIDSDDWVHSTYIETLVEVITKNDADAVAVGFVKVNELTNKEEKSPITDDICILDRMQTLNQACDPHRPWVGYACGKILKKMIIDRYQIRFNESVLMCEDSLFHYEFFSHADKIIKLPDCLYYYLQRKTSATNSAKKNSSIYENKLKGLSCSISIASNYPDSIFEKRIINAIQETYLHLLLAIYNRGAYDKNKGTDICKKIKSFGRPKLMSKGLLFRFYLLCISPCVLFVFQFLYSKIRNNEY